jgi:molecular chaperone GrpE
MKEKHQGQGKEELRAEDAPEEVIILREELESLRKKAAERDELHNKWLSVHAEYENTRRRMEKEKGEFLKYACEDIVARLFPIVDNFDMALASMDKAKDKAQVMDGIKLVQKEFHKVLEDNGVTKIKTEGAIFDPHVHDAVMMVENPELAEGTVVEELRPGYLLREKLLRPAQVTVSKGKSQ